MMCRGKCAVVRDFFSLLPCSLRLLRYLLHRQDEMRHMHRERSRPMREGYHGIRVAPSGLFPSIRERPIGFLVAGI